MKVTQRKRSSIRCALCVGLSLACARALSAQTPAPAAPPPPPAYQALRFDEDWSYLKDASRSSDPWDPVKYIPLNDAGWYASLGGEVRERYEAFANSGFGAGPQNPRGYLLQRYQLHVDVHAGSHVRFFTQLQSGLEDGRHGGPRPTDEDQFEFHQAFADVKFGSSARKTAYVRLGRQEFEFGAGRLISASESLNVCRGFDGARASGQLGAWTFHAIVARPVETNRGVFDDAPNGNQGVWGVGVVRPSGLLKGSNFSLYYIGFDHQGAVFTSGSAHETRHSVGSRLFGAVPAWDYNYELIGQFGSFGPATIRAWAVSTDTGRSFPALRFKPRFGLRVDVGSGDHDPTDGTLQTFNPLFPSTAYSGRIGLMGPQNIIDVEPSVRLRPTARLTTTLEWGGFWRQSLHDGIYGISLDPIKSGRASRSRYIASQPDLQAAFAVDRHLTIVGILTQFRSGAFIHDTPPSKNIGFGSVYFTYRF